MRGDNLTDGRRPTILTLGAGVAPDLHEAGADTRYSPADSWEALTLLNEVDGVLLTGGGDVNPELYGQDRRQETYGVDVARDAVETAVILDAIGRGLPVMGICRGMQILNVTLGGTLLQDVEAVGHEKHWGRDHGVMLERDSALGRAISGNLRNVVSLHHQALDAVAPELMVTGYGGHGMIEAVESVPGLPFLLGVQFHPELDWSNEAMAIFKLFIQRVCETERGRDLGLSPSPYTDARRYSSTVAGCEWDDDDRWAESTTTWAANGLGEWVRSIYCKHPGGRECATCVRWDDPLAVGDDDRDGYSDWWADQLAERRSLVHGITDRMSGGGTNLTGQPVTYVCGLCPGNRRWKVRDRFLQHLGSVGHKARERAAS